MSAVRGRLISAGVANLKEFGYPDVDAATILTDYVFSAFFLSMLEDNLGQGADNEINELISEIRAARANVAGAL